MSRPTKHPFQTGALVVLMLLGSALFFMQHRAGALASLEAGVIQAESHVSTTSFFNSSPGNWIAGQNIAVTTDSRDPVLLGVAEILIAQLKELPSVKAVALYPPGTGPAPGTRLPDLFLKLSLPKFDRTGGSKRTVEANLVVEAGQDGCRPQHHTIDHLSPPVIALSAKLVLDHQSVTHGYRTEESRDAAVIQSMAAQISTAVKNMIEEQTAKHGTPGALPEGFFPVYRPVPADLPLPADPGLKQILSGNGFMRHNTTVWMLDTTDPQNLLTDLKKQLTAIKWQCDRQPDSLPVHLRATRQGQVLEAFVNRDDENRAPAPGTSVCFVIRFVDRMTREDLRPVFSEMLANDAFSPAEWSRFRMLLTDDLRDQALSGFLQLTGTCFPVDLELALTRHLHQMGRTNEAMARLQSAQLAALIEEDRTDEVNRLGEELTGQKGWQLAPLTEQALLTAGFKNVTPERKSVSEARQDVPGLYYQNGPEPGQLSILAVTIERPKSGAATYTLALRARTLLSHGSSFRSITGTQSAGPWHAATNLSEGSVQWRAKAKETAPGTFQVEVETGNVE